MSGPFVKPAKLPKYHPPGLFPSGDKQKAHLQCVTHLLSFGPTNILKRVSFDIGTINIMTSL